MSTSPNIAAMVCSADSAFLQPPQSEENTSPNTQNKPNNNLTPINHQNALVVDNPSPSSRSGSSANLGAYIKTPESSPDDKQVGNTQTPDSVGVGTSLGMGGGVVGDSDRGSSLGIGHGNLGVGTSLGIGGGPNLKQLDVDKHVYDNRNVATTHFYVAPPVSTPLSKINQEEEDQRILEAEAQQEERTNSQILNESNPHVQEKNSIGAETAIPA